MKLKFALTLGVAVIVTAAAAACGGPPPPPPQPAVDSAAIRDSIARARADSIARARAREDSIRRARERDEAMRRAREDSVARATTAAVRAMLQARVNFDFDRSNIRPGDARVLDQKLAILQANPNLRIQITGHCDERGSDEYNMALGNRRALAARAYLTDRGIAADRIGTRSMGERQPLAAGSNETAWAQNRRDEFEITAGGDRLVRPGGM